MPLKEEVPRNSVRARGLDDDPAHGNPSIMYRRDPGEMITDAASQLAELAASVDAERLFLACIAELSVSVTGPATEASHGTVPALVEVLAFHLYPFFGTGHHAAVSPRHITKAIGAARTFFAGRSLPRPDDYADDVAALLSSVRRRTGIVRGDSFPEQTADRICSVQGNFEAWFEARAGIGPIRAQAILWSLHRARVRRLNSLILAVQSHIEARGGAWVAARRTRSRERSAEARMMLGNLRSPRDAFRFYFLEGLGAFAADHLPVGQDNLELCPAATDREWLALLQCLALTQENRAAMNLIDVRGRPLFALSGGRAVLICLSHALDVLWETYEDLAREEPSFYQEYQRYKARWLESRVTESLVRVFPRRHVYCNLSYPNPDRAGGTAELDLAITYGPFLLLVEAKASQFRIESQLGDAGRLRTDLRKNVEEAFDQAKRAARSIGGSPAPVLIEKGTGRKLVIDQTRVQRVYLLTVSLRYLSGLATSLTQLRDLGLFVGKELPFAISLDDLSTIIEFCDGPDVLLHFIERALAVQASAIELVADELDLFGAYLDMRLQHQPPFGATPERINMALLAGWSQQFDDWYDFQRGDSRSQPERPKLNVPTPIREVLAELRRRHEDSARWIAFTLLDLSPAALKALAEAFQEIRQAVLRPDQVRHILRHGPGLALSVVGALDPPSQQFEEKVFERADIEKYRTRARRSIAFGVAIERTDQAFETCVLLDDPWKYDQTKEALLRTQAPVRPIAGRAAPGRNDPCFCGSGKKFKKCCLPGLSGAA